VGRSVYLYTCIRVYRYADEGRVMEGYFVLIAVLGALWIALNG